MASMLLVVSCETTARLGTMGGDPETVPLLRLIVDGATYDGREVWVSGVLRVEYEGDSLYLTREHFEMRIRENSVWVSFYEGLDAEAADLARLNGRYVYVQGTFSATEHGHGVRRNGSIQRVTQILTR